MSLVLDPLPDSDNHLASRSSRGTAKVSWPEGAFCGCLSQSGQAILSQDRSIEVSETPRSHSVHHCQPENPTDVRSTRRSTVRSEGTCKRKSGIHHRGRGPGHMKRELATGRDRSGADIYGFRLARHLSQDAAAHNRSASAWGQSRCQ
jgi:hypothetical protein